MSREPSSNLNASTSGNEAHGLALRRRGSANVISPLLPVPTHQEEIAMASPTIYSTPRLSFSPAMDVRDGSSRSPRESLFSTLPAHDDDERPDRFIPPSYDVLDDVQDAPTYLPTPPSSLPGSAKLEPSKLNTSNQRRYSSSNQLMPESSTVREERSRTISAPDPAVGHHGAGVPLMRTRSNQENALHRPLQQYHHTSIYTQPSNLSDSRSVLTEERGRHVNLLSVDDSPAKLKKRPSLVLTMDTAPTTASTNPGLGVNVDMSGGSSQSPLPSPTGSIRAGTTRRAYPNANSAPPSPLLGPTSASPSTAPSPTSGYFPKIFGGSSNSDELPSTISPVIASISPSLSPVIAPSISKSPSVSPRLGTLTEPLGRLASGLVRRASNSNLGGSSQQLPMAQARRASDTPSSTTSSKNLAPSTIVTMALPRKASYASQAREKEHEKKKEVQERESKKRAMLAHNRAFSWAVRPGDIVASAKGKKRAIAKLNPMSSAPSVKRQALIVGAVMVLGFWWFSPSASFRSSRSVHPPPHETPMNEGVVRKPRPDGKSFIHPDVIYSRRQPKQAPQVGFLQSLLRQMSLVSDDYSTPAQKPKLVTPLHPNGYDEKKKHRNIFVAAPHVNYSDHEALPPPLEHSDVPERDTLVLYRILGNDLPPRHSPGQTLRNLRFLLQHESDFSALPPLGPHQHHHAHAYGSGSSHVHTHHDEGGLRVDKYFVLNRIADAQMVQAIIHLLHTYSVPESRILVVPFEWSEYARREFRWDGGVDNAQGWDIGDHAEARPDPRYNPPEDYVLTDEDAEGMTHEQIEARNELKERRLKRDVLIKLRAIDFTYHEKNLYAMNNNGGRNFALMHGRKLPNARWILPLDGNSFLTPAAMYSIVQTLSIAGEGAQASRYLLMPMARLLSNEDVRENNTMNLVPKHHEHHGRTAIEDAEWLSRPDTAPDTPEEPQIGFRYDSTESFQEAMRYGRRSKLEFLWRLGGIPYARGLDQRTLPWEATDRAHVTATTWKSIPGAAGTNANASIHQPIQDQVDPNIKEPGGRGPPAFVKAGWVYRLFSGYKSQEIMSSEAVMLRNTNRIKGIISFLEKLDEQLARGEEGCSEDEDPADCGFEAHRYWNFDEDHLDILRALYDQGDEAAIEKVERFQHMIEPSFDWVEEQLSWGQGHFIDPTTAGQHALMFAVAGYLTSISHYSELACELIETRFIKQLPLYYRQNDQRVQQLQYSGLEGEDDTAFRLALSEHGSSYAFPPPPIEPGQIPTWSADLGRRVSAADIPQLPFDPLHFDPSMLLDAVRLLGHAAGPEIEEQHMISQKAVQPMLVAHLSWLLYSPTALEFSRRPPSAAEGGSYDAKIATLAAFLNDAKLLGRVANRARLRLSRDARQEGIMFINEEVKAVHWRLVQGLAHIRFRPYSMIMDLDSLEHGGWEGNAHGYEIPLDVLHVY